MTLTWTWREFNDLSGAEMHEMLAARQRVFVVEQASPYQDADPLDQLALHLVIRASDGQFVAYARVLPPEAHYAEPTFGRVLVMPQLRGTGIGREIVRQCLEKCASVYGAKRIRISAQRYLIDFYTGFGFEPVSPPFDDGGVEHVEMLWVETRRAQSP
ncbi:MAG: GNAT family N-acetyltransferase [Cyanobacteria bacterium J06635_11]